MESDTSNIRIAEAITIAIIIKSLEFILILLIIFRPIPKLFPTRFSFVEFFAIAFFATRSVFFYVVNISSRQDLNWPPVMTGKIMSAYAQIVCVIMRGH